jgi:hypothetical protein
MDRGRVVQAHPRAGRAPEPCRVHRMGAGSPPRHREAWTAVCISQDAVRRDSPHAAIRNPESGIRTDSSEQWWGPPRGGARSRGQTPRGTVARRSGRAAGDGAGGEGTGTGAFGWTCDQGVGFGARLARQPAAADRRLLARCDGPHAAGSGRDQAAAGRSRPDRGPVCGRGGGSPSEGYRDVSRGPTACRRWATRWSPPMPRTAARTCSGSSLASSRCGSTRMPSSRASRCAITGLQSSPPREREITREISVGLFRPLSQRYVQAHFPDGTRRDVTRMVGVHQGRVRDAPAEQPLARRAHPCRSARETRPDRHRGRLRRPMARFRRDHHQTRRSFIARPMACR